MRRSRSGSTGSFRRSNSCGLGSVQTPSDRTRSDLERDFYLYHRGKRGFEVVHLSEEQVDEEPERVAEFLHEVLASRPHRVAPDGG